MKLYFSPDIFNNQACKSIIGEYERREAERKKVLSNLI